MMARPKGKPRAMKDIRQAVKMYIDGVKMDDIAAKFHVTQPTVSYWMKRHGEDIGKGDFIQAQRKQGRRAETAPNERDAKIMTLVALGVPAAKVGQDHGLARQRAWFIVKTWTDRGYKPAQPYKVGQVLKYGNRPERYIIQEITEFSKCRALQIVGVEGQRMEPAVEVKDLPWFFQGELAEVVSDTAGS